MDGFVALCPELEHLMPIYGSKELADRLVQAFKAIGQKPNIGKACIRFQTADDLPIGAIEEIVAKFSVDRWVEIAQAARGSRFDGGASLKDAMPMRPQPLLAVKDVESSSQWYQQLMGLQSAHGGPEYERLVHGGTLVLQLHAHEVEHHHGPLSDPQQPLGNGVLLWFEVDNFEDVAQRAAAMRVEVVKPKHRNPPDGDGGPNHWELWLCDPDGYVVVLASPDGSATDAPAA